MTDEFLGEIRLFAGDFAPRNFVFCNGQLYPIRGNEKVYAILGTKYGGDGINNFAVPNLRSCLPMHFNNDVLPGRSLRPLGKAAGQRTTVLTAGQMPAHNHTVLGNALEANTTDPSPNVFPGKDAGSRPAPGPSVYKSGLTAATPLHTNSVADFGADQPQPLDLSQPSQALNFIICTSIS